MHQIVLSILFFSTSTLAQTPSTQPTPWKVYQEWPFSATEAKRRQEETANALGVPIEKSMDLGHGVKMALVLIPAGRFIMGTPEPLEPDWKSLKWPIQMGQGVLVLGIFLIWVLIVPELWRSIGKRNWPRMSLGRLFLIFLSLSLAILGGTGWWEGGRVLSLAQMEFETAKIRYAEAGADEKPSRWVNISKPFFMGRYEVTQEEWEEVMKKNTSSFKCTRGPVESAWDDIQAFLEKVRGIMGQEVRLPSEAEWEYSCRAGSASCFHSGESYKELAEVGWYFGNSNAIGSAGCEMSVVGQKKPNAFVLYDTHGNVDEWCQDWFGPYPARDQIDPLGPTTGWERVIRGGCSASVGSNCRSASRGGRGPGDYRRGLGFRLLAVQQVGKCPAGHEKWEKEETIAKKPGFF